MVAKSVVKRWPTGVRTRGCQTGTSVQRAEGDIWGAHGAHGWATGGWSTTVDDKLTGEEVAVGETRAPGAAAGGSSSNWALDDEGDTVGLQAGSNGGRGGRVVVLTDE
jgi:hypothetical protein